MLLLSAFLQSAISKSGSLTPLGAFFGVFLACKKQDAWLAVSSRASENSLWCLRRVFGAAVERLQRCSCVHFCRVPPANQGPRRRWHPFLGCILLAKCKMHGLLSPPGSLPCKYEVPTTTPEEARCMASCLLFGPLHPQFLRLANIIYSTRVRLSFWEFAFGGLVCNVR